MHYAASDIFLDTLSNPAVSHTYDSNKTAFQQAVGTQLSLFDWMQQMVPETDADWRPLPLRKHPCEEDDTPVGFEDSSQRVIPRPEKQQFQLVMAGVGRVYGQGLVHDFPWKNLNQDATVVDVGGGIGKFQISTSPPLWFLRIRPDLKLILAQVPSACNCTVCIPTST